MRLGALRLGKASFDQIAPQTLVQHCCLRSHFRRWARSRLGARVAQRFPETEGVDQHLHCASTEAGRYLSAQQAGRGAGHEHLHAAGIDQAVYETLPARNELDLVQIQGDVIPCARLRKTAGVLLEHPTQVGDGDAGEPLVLEQKQQLRFSGNAATSGQAAIRTDGWQRGTLVSENVIVNCACGVMRKNYNHVENNVIIDARADIGAIAFRHFPEDEQTSGARVQRNICVQRREAAPFYAVREPPPVSGCFTRPADCHVDLNLFYNLADPADGERFLAQMRGQHVEAHSLAEDPRLNDLAARGLVLAPDSPAHALGFAPIDLRRIGLGPSFPDTLRRRYSGTIEEDAESPW